MINHSDLQAFAPKEGELILFTPPPGASGPAIQSALAFLKKCFPKNEAIAVFPGQEIDVLPVPVVAKLIEHSMRAANEEAQRQLEAANM